MDASEEEDEAGAMEEEEADASEEEEEGEVFEEEEEDGALEEDVVAGLGTNDNVDFFLGKRYALAPENFANGFGSN